MPGSAALAQSSSQLRSFNIAPQPLASALRQFAEQSGMQLAYRTGDLRGVNSPGFRGQAANTQVLGQLLSGTNVSYTVTAANTVTIRGADSPETGAASGGAIQLDTIDVSDGRVSRQDAPFQMPGSPAYISREELDRVPPISAGDVFRTTPGVISAGNRVGTSVNPNIRGIQGMGRIATSVDCARQTSSSYRGYIGNRDETYIDPDMIGGIDISKGPSEGAGDCAGVGGIGGSINFRTLNPSDIVKDGKNYGVRLKGDLGSNTVTPRAPAFTGAVSPNKATEDRPSLFNGEAYSGSFAIAAIKEQYEFIAAYSKRVQGNYFVGTKVPPGLVFPTGNVLVDIGRANAAVRPGTEAFNTSEDTDSFLAKGKVKWGDGQSLELGYLHFGSRYGEIDELSFTPAQQILPYGQFPLSETRTDTYTAKYKYKPSSNPYVNFRANLWLSDVDSRRNYGAISGPYGIRTTGGDVGNASVFTTPIGELTIDNGLEVLREQPYADQFATSVTGSEGWMTFGPSGIRTMGSAFSNANLKATHWLTLTAGARYDYFNAEGEGYLTKFPEKNGGRLSPQAAIVLTPFEGIQLFGQYKTGYRPPSLRESHWHYEGLLRNNPKLRPEIAENVEVGLNVLRQNVIQSGDKLRFKLAYFENHYDDYIIRTLRSNRGGQNIYHWWNIDSANFHGYEISGGYDAGKYFVEGAFTKYTSIEYCPTPTTCQPPAAHRRNLGASPTSPLQNDYAMNYIPPDYAGSVTAGVRLFDQKLTLGGRTHFAATRSGVTGPISGSGQIGYEFTWPAYRVYDVFASYKLNADSTLHFSLENITDEYYFGALSSAGIPSPGRTGRLSLTTTFNDTKPLIPDLSLGSASYGAPGSNWTGLYLGGHLGYGFADTSGVTTTASGAAGGIPATESTNLGFEDLTKGFQAGFNYQFSNRLVLGVEADYSWTKLKDEQEAITAHIPIIMQRRFLQAKTEYSFDWLATLRGRVGYAFDRIFVYGTGGLAFLHETQVRTQYIDGSANNTMMSFKESAWKTRSGWTLGGGFEYALANHWALKGEYLYAHFGAEDFLFPGARSGVTTAAHNIVNGRKASNDVELNSVKVGLNYRF